MMQDFINKHFFNLYIFILTLGMITYGLIGFQAVDELSGVILFIMFIFYMFNTKGWEINKFFLYVLGIFSFYLCYSFYIESNTKKAILVDFIIQLKPYIAFFCAYQLMPCFSKKQISLLNKYSVLCWVLLIPIGIIGFIQPSTFKPLMGHASNYAAAISALSLTYLYTSKDTTQNKLIFICMLALGLASGRAKFYGFFVFAVFITFFFSNVKNIKINFKNSIIALLMLGAIFLVAKEKIDIYFLQGLNPESETEKDSIARFVLYATSFLIFKDYMPFGSGFASYGTHASGLYYSPIYKEYGIDGVWGLNKEYPFFISDTYYPSLAQFGVIGVFLFFFFWLYLCKKAYHYFQKTADSKLTTLVIIISGYFAIENIADATFTSHRGFFFMMFLGLIFANMKQGISQKEMP